jgi:hypothetical protein
MGLDIGVQDMLEFRIWINMDQGSMLEVLGFLQSALTAGYREPQIQPWDGEIIRTTGSR